MHQRSISPHPGFRFYAHSSLVDQGVEQIEEMVRQQHQTGDVIEAYDPVEVTLKAQAHALFRMPACGTA